MSRGEALSVIVLNYLKEGWLVLTLLPRVGSPRSAVRYCRELAFVEFRPPGVHHGEQPSIGVVLLQQRLEAGAVAKRPKRN